MSLQHRRGGLDELSVVGEQGKTGVTASTSVAAYDPATGRQAWIVELPGSGNSGSVVTAGDVLFQPIGNGDFYALDARSGQTLLKVTLPRGIRATPLTYQVAGRQYVAIVATNAVSTFALP